MLDPGLGSVPAASDQPALPQLMGAPQPTLFVQEQARDPSEIHQDPVDSTLALRLVCWKEVSFFFSAGVNETYVAGRFSQPLDTTKGGPT